MCRLFSLIYILLIPQFIFTQEWVARYNGPSNSYDYAYAIAVDDAGSIYVTGGSPGIGTDYDYATVKYNSVGVEQWVSRYNGPGNGFDSPPAIAIDNTGAVYITGVSVGSGTDRDYATVKYDTAGMEQWVARYNGPGNGEDWAYAAVVDDAGAIYITGWSVGDGTDYDYATVKYDADGQEQWVARYNGPGNGEDYAYAIAVDDAGSIYVTGGSRGLGTDYDYATVKYNSSGVEQWVARFNGSINENDHARAIVLNGTDDIYVTGWSFNNGTFDDYATVKYNAEGVEQWVVWYDGPDNFIDQAYAIATDNAGSIYITGSSDGSGTGIDYATVKYDADGQEQWVARYNGPDNFSDYAVDITVDILGNIYITGYSTGLGSAMDFATIKYLPTGIEEYHTNQLMSRDIKSTIFRGPLILPENKKCKVFDITGRVVKPQYIDPGIYFIEIDGVVIQKVVKVR